MGAARFTNNGTATLASGINASVTTIALTAGHGARFPNPAGGDYFWGTLVDAANNIEIVKVTGRATDSLTVVRAQESTTAKSYLAGDVFELRPTAAGLEGMVQNISAGTGLSVTGTIERTVSRASGYLGYVLLGTQTGNSTSNWLQFVNLFSATYDEYLLTLSYLLPAQDGEVLMCQVGTGTTPTWNAGTNNYASGGVVFGFDGALSGFGSASSPDTPLNTAMLMNKFRVGYLIGSAAGEGVSGDLRIHSPFTAGNLKAIQFDLMYGSQASFQHRIAGGGWCSITTSATSIRVGFSNSVVVSGTARLYGLEK